MVEYVILESVQTATFDSHTQAYLILDVLFHSIPLDLNVFIEEMKKNQRNKSVLIVHSDR